MILGISIYRFLNSSVISSVDDGIIFNVFCAQKNWVIYRKLKNACFHNFTFVIQHFSLANIHRNYLHFSSNFISSSAIFRSFDKRGTLFCPPNLPIDFIYLLNPPFSIKVIFNGLNIFPLIKSK